MTSKRVSELFGDGDLPTTGEDVEALRRDRPLATGHWLAELTALAAFAAPSAETPQTVAARRQRRTFAGLPPFEL